MIRFTANEMEIERILRFLSRRMAGKLRAVPLEGKGRDDLRFRHTLLPLIHRLESNDDPLAWGLCRHTEREPPLTVRRNGGTRLKVEAEASHLIVLDLGPAEGLDRKREGILSVRDWLGTGEQSGEINSEALFARHLVERCARSIRRRGCLESGRWHLPC